MKHTFTREKRQLRRELLTFIKFLQRKHAREISSWNQSIMRMRRRGAVIDDSPSFGIWDMKEETIHEQ